MDRVKADVAVATAELDLDNGQVVDVVEVVSDVLLRVPVVVFVNDKIAAGARRDLVRDMARQDKLTFAPLYLDL